MRGCRLSVSWDGDMDNFKVTPHSVLNRLKSNAATRGGKLTKVDKYAFVGNVVKSEKFLRI